MLPWSTLSRLAAQFPVLSIRSFSHISSIICQIPLNVNSYDLLQLPKGIPFQNAEIMLVIGIDNCVLDIVVEEIDFCCGEKANRTNHCSTCVTR